MVGLKVVTDLARLPRDLKKWDKNRRFAIAVGITRTAWDVNRGLRKNMQEVFDRPTRFTLNALRVRPAKRDDYDARVFLEDFAGKGTPARDFLEAQIEGGNRQAKRFERLLRRRGFLQPNEFMVPGKGAKLNAAGNIPGSQYSKALADIGGHHDPSQTTTRKQVKYFWLPKAGRRLAGIYYKKGGRNRSFLVVVRQPVYRRRFDFYREADTLTDKHLKPNLDKAMAQYLDGR
ncbi:MAG: hypothetical protein QNJ14_19540 [Woeseiaceae bacterium]|nr:hypothetical protein [Woeseiaceae bacterium]